MLPAGWKKRLVREKIASTGGIEGLCLEGHDRALSKYAAGRRRDLEFTRALARHGMTRRRTLLARAATTALTPEVRRRVEGRIVRDFGRARPGKR